ncbi:DUF4167 domain-containing protein [Gymnodinialimonas sp. 2305UL16-5]|uniref:DUF4167 domain-containing protein n=1 Tax=Gymnodinialimonas mytili TaxID=3126503 RepID=UPI00309BC9BC
MRSSKNRSRSKGNRNRSVGNIVNRVFDSSGPEGKVRGTPQQIIDKYNQLTRDAQLSNDRVAAENFQQHAEHYLRMLGEAQREMEAKREQQQQQNQNQNQNNRGQQGGNPKNQGGGGGDQQPQPQSGDQGRQPQQPQPEAAPEGQQPAQGGFDAVIETDGGESGLVETPENPAPKPKRTRSRRRKADPAPDAGEASGEAAPAAPEDGDKPPQEAAE